MQLNHVPTFQEIDREIADDSDLDLRRAAAVEVPPDNPWAGLTNDERRALRARNLLAKRDRERQLQAEKDAQAAKAQARRDMEAQEQIEAFKRQARLAVPGTEAEWSEAWPAIKQAWQVEQTMRRVNDADRALAERRALYDSLMPE